jgi:hypothetical protein
LQAKLVIEDNFPSRASVDYARAETLHMMTVLKDEELFSLPDI